MLKAMLSLALAPGASCADLLEVLLAAGASRARIERAIAALDLPLALDLDALRVTPEHHGLLVRATDVDALLQRDGIAPPAALLATEAIAKLLVGASGGEHGRFMDQRLDAGTLVLVLAACVAIVDLGGPEEAHVAPADARVGPDARAVLEAVADSR